MGFTYRVSNDENWDLELRRFVWGKSLYRTDGPFIRGVTGVAVVRIRPSKMYPHART